MAAKSKLLVLSLNFVEDNEIVFKYVISFTTVFWVKHGHFNIHLYNKKQS